MLLGVVLVLSSFLCIIFRVMYEIKKRSHVRLERASRVNLLKNLLYSIFLVSLFQFKLETNWMSNILQSCIYVEIVNDSIHHEVLEQAQIVFRLNPYKQEMYMEQSKKTVQVLYFFNYENDLFCFHILNLHRHYLSLSPTTMLKLNNTIPNSCCAKITLQRVQLGSHCIKPATSDDWLQLVSY